MNLTTRERRDIVEIRIRPFIVVVCLFFLMDLTAAQDDASPKGAASHSEVNETSIRKTDDSQESADGSTSTLVAERKKKATAAMAAIGGIAILGIAAITVTMLWARRLRRLARNLGPPQKTEGNDFWFLKPPKPMATESDIAENHRPPHSPSAPETSD